MLIHAGLGIEPLGGDALRLVERFPRATLILAHAAITDLAWIADELDDHPSILFDTAWWLPADLLALFALVQPERILFGSDTPDGYPGLNAIIALRCARAVGLADEQIRSVMGGQLERLLAGQALTDVGPPPGSRHLERDVLLARVGGYLDIAWGMGIAGRLHDPSRAPLVMAPNVAPRHPRRETSADIAAALELPPFGPWGWAPSRSRPRARPRPA